MYIPVIFLTLFCPSVLSMSLAVIGRYKHCVSTLTEMEKHPNTDLNFLSELTYLAIKADSDLLRDLRGNSFRCDCKIKWLVDWLEKSNTSVPAIYCASPFEFQGRRIHDLTPRDFNCISAGFTFPQSNIVSWHKFLFCKYLSSTLSSHRFCCLRNLPFPLGVSGVLSVQWGSVCGLCSAGFRVLHLVCMGSRGDGLQEVS